MNVLKSVSIILTFAANLASAATDPRPNILFIMSDDHAAHAVSAYGSKVNQTPEIDRLARDGVRFANAFVCNSICTPSRASILTGKYSHLNGVPVFNRFDGSQPTVAKMLQAAGYHTGMIGKWHLGSDPTGFDRWIVLPGQGVYNDPAFLTSKGRLTIKGYATDVITDLGIEFLQTRPKDKPFFLMLHHKAPHRGWTPDEKYRVLFKSRVFPEPETLYDDYATRPAALPVNEQTVANDMMRSDLKLTPPAGLSAGERAKWLAVKPTEVDLTNADGSIHKLTDPELAKWKYQRYMQDYLACVQSLDDGVGRVLDYLDRTGLATNTVVFYTADNGFFLGDHGLYDKRFMYEHSLRVPLLVRGPGVKRGGVPEGFALNVDLAPTFLDLAGEKIPVDMQGSSLVPLLHGESPANWRSAMYYRYYHDPGDHNTRAHYGLRTATHKLIYYWKQDAWELFDLRNDANELHNLAGDPGQAGTLAKLKQQLKELKVAMKDEDQFAKEQPPQGVGGATVSKPAIGRMTVRQAIESSAATGRL